MARQYPTLSRSFHPGPVWFRGIVTRQKDWDEAQYERDLRRPAGSMRYDRAVEDGCFYEQKGYQRGHLPGKRRSR